MGAAGWHLDLAGPLITVASEPCDQQHNQFDGYTIFFKSFAKAVVFLPPFLATSCSKLFQTGFVSDLRFSFF